MFSYSKVNCYWECPFKYRLRYIDKLKPLPDLRANNPLVEGSALHLGVEKDSISEGIEYYKKYYYDNGVELTSEHEFEIEKLKEAITKAIQSIPKGEYEYVLKDPDGFIGYIDVLVEIEPGIYDLYDIKYSNNINKYSNSNQVSVYKYYYEKITGNKIRNMYYAMIPKLMETLNESLDKEAKLKEYIDNSEVTLNKIEYDKKQVSYFFARKVMMEKDDKFIKRQSGACRWCEFKHYCESNGEDRSELVDEA